MRAVPDEPPDAIDDAVAAAETVAAVPVQAMQYVPPTPGSLSGTIQVQLLSNASGKWVRLLWVAAHGVTVIDLPTRLPNGRAITW